jgi:hypothetical protein
MLPILISFPILTSLVMFQSAVISRIHLLYGTADLLLLALVAWALQERVTSAWYWALVGGLVITIASAVPPGVLFAGYLVTVAVALLLRRRVWQLPFLAMLVTTFLGTLIIHGFSTIAIIASGTALPVLSSFDLITLPSLLLNLLLAVPMYAIMSDLANWLYPQEIEV